MIAKLIDEYAKGKTRILVSHDLSTVIDADAILVMDHGRVAGFGTHEELLRSCPQYAGLLSAGEEVVRRINEHPRAPPSVRRPLR